MSELVLGLCVRSPPSPPSHQYHKLCNYSKGHDRRHYNYEVPLTEDWVALHDIKDNLMDAKLDEGASAHSKQLHVNDFSNGTASVP